MDKTPADQPSNEPPDGESIPEQELLDVLAEASKLARELAVQLDGEQLPPMDDAPGLEPKSSKVEDQLNDLDVLVATTSDELGEAPPSPDESFGSDVASSSEDAAATIPDFMDEFTHATGAGDGPSDSSPAPTDAPLASDGGEASPGPLPQAKPKPGVIGTGIIGVATAKPPAPQPFADDDPVEEASSRRSVTPRETFARFTGLATSAAQSLLTLTLPAADRVVGLLEKGDRPLAKLNAPIRRVIGWLAIATLGTSAFVFFWSLT